MLKTKHVLSLLMLIISIPAIVSAAESMSMVQLGISGAITTPGIILADLAGDGASYVIVGTSTGLYILDDKGDLVNYIQTSSSVTNVAVLDDLTGDGKLDIVITTEDAYFPNVGCYNSITGEKIWEFSPKTEVYDPYILWTMLQTRVFDMESISDLNGNGYKDVVLSSGYNVYALDGKTGAEIWKWQDTDNVWDLLVIDDQDGDGKPDVLAGDQNGYVYLISGDDGENIWSKYLAEMYTVIDPSRNSEAGTVKRSVWDIVYVEVGSDEKVAVSAEDGYVYLLDVKTGEIEWKQEIIDYVDALLYAYYGDQPLPTSSTDYNFFNLRVNIVDDVTGDGNKDIIASSFTGLRWGREYKGVEGIYLLDSDSGEIEWKNENTELSYINNPALITIDDEPYIAVPVGKTGTKEKVKLIDPADGSTHEIINVNSTSGQAKLNTYFLKPFGEDTFIMVSNYGDLLLLEYPNDVVWNYPKISNIVVRKGDLTGDSTLDMLVKSRDRVDSENPFDEGQSRTIFVVDGSTREIAWSYTLPYGVFLEIGGLSAVKVAPDLNKDGKSDIIAYLQYFGDWNRGDMYGDKTRILVFNGKNGRIIMNKSVVDSEYYGIYDMLFDEETNLNVTIQKMMLKQMGLEENHLQTMPKDQREEFDRQFEDTRRDILNRKRDVKIKKRIESLDVIQDRSGDGVPDFIIGGWDDVFIMDSVTGEIVWNRTRRSDLYWNPLKEIKVDFYANWTENDRNRFFVVGDANGDGVDDLVLVNHDGLLFLHSNLTGGELDYFVAFKYTTKNGLNKEGVTKVDDLNGNGVDDLVFERHVEDAPSLYVFADGRNGYVIMEVERSGTAVKLGAADFNGNNFKDSIIFQMWSETGGPKLEIVDGRSKETIWSYNGIEETWMLRDLFGYNFVMPATPVGDMNGDGITDVAVAKSLAWQPGAEVVIYDAKNNEELHRVVVEDIDETRGRDMRWTPGINAEELADINGDGVSELGVIMIIGEPHQKEIKMFVIDIANSEIVADFTALGSEIINLGSESVGMIGQFGNVYFLDTSKDMSIIAPAKGGITGSPITVEWSGGPESVSTILVDNKKTLRTGDKGAEFEILSGSHKITVYSFDRYGKGVYDHVKVNVVKSSFSVTLTSIVVIVLLIILFIPKVYGMIFKVKK